MSKQKIKPRGAFADYFEAWVRQEQIVLWLLSLLLIGMSVLAFGMGFANPVDTTTVVETSAGTLEIQENEMTKALNSFLIWLPAIAGTFFIYWTSDREHVRQLTERLINQNPLFLRVAGLLFFVWGGFQLFSGGNLIQNFIIAPVFVAFGLFAIWRSFKIAGYRALEGE